MVVASDCTKRRLDNIRTAGANLLAIAGDRAGLVRVN
jgi:hypothetical protein